MEHPLAVGLAGIVLFLMGFSLQYTTARARFERRNPYGVMQFRGFAAAYGFNLATRAVDRVGQMLKICGALAVVAAMIGAGGGH